MQQRQVFLLSIGAAQFYILEVKNTPLSSVTCPRSLSCKNAVRQNRVLKAVYAVYNLLCSMSNRIGVTIQNPRACAQYIFSAPVPISHRPHLIHTICCKSVEILHQLRNSYLEYIKYRSQPIFLNKVNVYVYLLRKCIKLMQLVHYSDN